MFIRDENGSDFSNLCMQGNEFISCFTFYTLLKNAANNVQAKVSKL